MDNLQLQDNKEAKRFILSVEGHIAFINYTISQEKIFLVHVEVPEQLGGRGLGKKIVELALDHVEKEGLKIVPLCPFVTAYLKKNPERQVLLAEGFNIR